MPPAVRNGNDRIVWGDSHIGLLKWRVLTWRGMKDDIELVGLCCLEVSKSRSWDLLIWFLNVCEPLRRVNQRSNVITVMVFESHSFEGWTQQIKGRPQLSVCWLSLYCYSSSSICSNETLEAVTFNVFGWKPVGGEGYFCYLVPCLLGRDLFIIKSNQVGRQTHIFFFKVYSGILPLSTELLNFVHLSLFFPLRLSGNFLSL